MLYLTKSWEMLNRQGADRLQFVGFGIFQSRTGVEQIIPNLYNQDFHYSFIFNHDPVCIAVNGKENHLPANTLVLWDQSCHVYYGTRRQGWRLSWLQCRGDEVEKRLRKYRTPLNHPITFDNDRIIRRYWNSLYEELSEYTQLDVAIILNCINGIFLEMHRMIHAEACPTARIPESFLEIRSILDRNFAKHITLTQLAKRMHLSSVYFSRKFKEYFGIAPIDYVISLRMQDAVLHLQNTELSVKEVAWIVGYEDAFHFSKLFKRHFRTSPQSFRNALSSRSRAKS